jgi:hypothetical protein
VRFRQLAITVVVVVLVMLTQTLKDLHREFSSWSLGGFGRWRRELLAVCRILTKEFSHCG